MTTEEDFQAALDAHPDDWQTRLIFADWLDERGDPRGPGYRALGVLRRRPVDMTGTVFCWSFHNGKGTYVGTHKRRPKKHSLPQIWIDAMTSFSGSFWAHGGHSRGLSTRRAAEDAAALAFARLPAARQRALLEAKEVTT